MVGLWFWGECWLNMKGYVDDIVKLCAQYFLYRMGYIMSLFYGNGWINKNVCVKKNVTAIVSRADMVNINDTINLFGISDYFVVHFFWW